MEKEEVISEATVSIMDNIEPIEDRAIEVASPDRLNIIVFSFWIEILR